MESIPLIASSIMSKKLASGLDALVLDVKVGAGAFMKKQVEARRLAQIMVGIGRRMGNKRVQALITNMDQPLGYAIGNALEVMEVSQTLQNVGPVDLHEISIELAARMIHLGKKADSIDRRASSRRRRSSDGSAYRKLKEVIQAQGGNPQVLDRFELLPNATGAREILCPRSGYISAINAEDIGLASTMIGAGRDRKEDVDRSGGRCDSRSQSRPEDRCGLGAVPHLLHDAKSVWKTPPNWWKTRSASPPIRPMSAI